MNQPPAVSWSNSGAGTYQAPATFSLRAAASDADGAVASVDFYVNSILYRSDGSTPYDVQFSSVPVGTYSIIAVATDNAGATSASVPLTIQVIADDLPRAAVFVASPDHDTAVDRYVLDIFESGANPATATPVATGDLGKPSVVNGECQADITSVVTSLAPGTSFATVSALNTAGRGRSTPSTAFTIR